MNELLIGVLTGYGISILLFGIWLLLVLKNIDDFKEEHL